jgi:hypothetical protein
MLLLSGTLFAGFAQGSAAAQESRTSRLAIDTSAAVDTSVNGSGDAINGLTADALLSFDLGGNLQFVTRPFLQRLGASGEWNAQVWLAALRYERTGEVAIRLDLGYIPSPVGMANLMLRPHSNPTIALPASLFSSLPLVDVGGPRTTLLGAIYPLGASATISSLAWDVRVAVMDTSPTRSRRIFSDGTPPNPPRFGQFVVGAGVTPMVGVRVGASLTRGGWERAGESPAASQDRSATIATVEADVSRGHTRLQAEFTYDRFEVNNGPVVARGAFLQGQHTLSPRWFVAGRVERVTSPAIFAAPDILSVVRRTQQLQGFEETLGFRLTADLTLRASHRMRRTFGRSDFDHVGAVSVVWWRRWR